MSSKSAETSASDTTKETTAALTKTKQAVSDIQAKLEPVLKRLRTDGFEDDATTNQAQASVALSIGMMRYMGARLRGLDQGRNADDPLRKELNKMKKVLAEIKQRRQKLPAQKPENDTAKTTSNAPSSEKKPAASATPSDGPASGKKRGRQDGVDGESPSAATPAKKTKQSPKPTSSSNKKKRRRR